MTKQEGSHERLSRARRGRLPALKQVIWNGVDDLDRAVELGGDSMMIGGTTYRLVFSQYQSFGGWATSLQSRRWLRQSLSGCVVLSHCRRSARTKNKTTGEVTPRLSSKPRW